MQWDKVVPWNEYLEKEREMEKLKCSVCKNMKIIVGLSPPGLSEEHTREMVCQKAEDGHFATLPYRLCAKCSKETKICIKCGQRRNDTYYYYSGWC